MSECRKRQLHLSSDAGSSCSEVPKGRVFQKKTVWVRSGFRSTTNSTTLSYGWSMTPSIVSKYLSKLWCSICLQFQKEFECMRNFKQALIDGSTNIRTCTEQDVLSLSFCCRCFVTPIWSWVYISLHTISSHGGHFVACDFVTRHFITNHLVTGTLSVEHEHNTCSINITLATYCRLGNFWRYSILPLKFLCRFIFVAMTTRRKLV